MFREAGFTAQEAKVYSPKSLNRSLLATRIEAPPHLSQASKNPPKLTILPILTQVALKWLIGLPLSRYL